MALDMIDVPADTRWLPVMIAKLDEDGDPLLNEEGDVIETPRMLEVATGDFYLNDPIQRVSTKCTSILIGLPFYTAGQMAWSVGRFFVDIPVIAGRAIAQLAADWKDKGVCKRFYLRIITEIPASMKRNLRHFVRAPIFACRVAREALYGIVFPFEGRKREAKVENQWQNGVSFKEHPKYQGLWNANASHLAQCFQPRGNIHNGRHVISRILIEGG